MTRRKWITCWVLVLLMASLLAQTVSTGSGATGQSSVVEPVRAANRLIYLPLAVKELVRTVTPAPTVTLTATPTGTATPTPTATPTTTPEALRPGDILTRDSTWISFMSAHDALYAGNGLIIDSVPEDGPANGVQYRSLADFIEDAYDYVLVHRLADWSEDAAQGALQYAIDHIGTPYDWNFLWGKATDEAMYCSELVWRSYLSQGYDLDSNGGSWVFPDDIVGSPLLIEVNAGLSPGGSRSSRVD